VGISFKINLDLYTNNFLVRIAADMVSLNTILSAIDSGTYPNNNGSAVNGITMYTTSPTVNDDLRSYEITKTFISMMRNVNDYMDRLIAIMLFVKKNHKLPRQFTDIGDVNEYVNNLILEELIEYCSKTKDLFKTKLDYFSNLPAEFIKYMTTYNLLRNCYEHHKAISKSTLQIPIKTWGIFTSDGKKVEIDKPIEGGTNISVVWSQKNIQVLRGEAVKLPYEDIVFTELYFHLMIPRLLIPQVVKTIEDSSGKSET